MLTSIVDANGNPLSLDAGSLAEPQTASTAWLHTEYENHPSRGLTPARLHQILVGAEQRDLAPQLDLADDIEERDGHCYAELAKRKMAVSSLEWDIVEPEGATAAEKSLTAEVREWMKGIPDFEDFVFDMLDATLKGYSCHEVVWSLQERVLMPQLTFRPQRWFTLAPRRDELVLRSQTEQIAAEDGLPPVMGEALRPFTWIVHRPKARTGYLSRAGLVRVLAWPYIFKNYAIRDLAEFLEIFGLPLRVGRYPAGASADEKRTLLRAVTEIGHNAAGIIPAGMAIEFQKAADGTQAPFASMTDLMDAIQSKVISGQTLTSSEGKHGTQALGDVHLEVFDRIIASDIRQSAGTINRQLIHPWVMLNKAGVDPRRLPGLKFDNGRAEDVVKFSTALPALAKAGMRIKVDWAHEKLRIPMGEESDELLTGGEPEPDGDEVDPTHPGGGQQPQPGTKPAATKPAAAKLAGELDPPVDPRDALDDVVDDMLGGWRDVMAPMVEQLLGQVDQAVARGETLEQFRERMPQLLDAMNHKPLAGTLARGAFVARLAGEADLNLGNE